MTKIESYVPKSAAIQAFVFDPEDLPEGFTCEVSYSVPDYYKLYQIFQCEKTLIQLVCKGEIVFQVYKPVYDYQYDLVKIQGPSWKVVSSEEFHQNFYSAPNDGN